MQEKVQKRSTLVILLHELEDDDILPLVDILLKVHLFNVDAVDILSTSKSVVNQESVVSLMRAVNSTLRIVDLQDTLFRKDILWYARILSCLSHLSFSSN